jgi:hypothetical protein
MTDENSIQRGLRCTGCNSAVYLARRENRTLAVTCDCDVDRSIKVATTLPEGWSA